MPNDPWTEELIKEIKNWASIQKRRNPLYSLNIGPKSFTIDQIVEHVDKKTPEGKQLLRMLAKYAILRFHKYSENLSE